MNFLFLCFSDNEYGDETSEGGAAFIILNPRNLNGHATIPAPPESRHSIYIRTVSFSYSFVQKSTQNWSVWSKMVLGEVVVSLP